MAKAQAANGRLAAAVESSYGVNPGSAFNFMRFTSEGLKHDISITESQEVRAGRNPLGAIRTNIMGRGPINFEAHMDAAFKNLLKGALCAPALVPIALTGKSIDISAVVGRTCRLTDAATSGAFTNVLVGQWIKMGGHTAVANHGYVHVTNKVSNNAVDVEGLAFVAETGQTDITLDGTNIRIGTTRNSFAIEKQFPDVNVYLLFLGAIINTLSFTMRSREIVTGSMEWWSKFPVSSGSTGAGTPSAAGTLRPANAIDNVINIREGILSNVSTMKASEITFELNNNLQDLPAIGVLGPDEIALGSVSSQGKMSLYLEDLSMITKIENATASVISWMLSWPSGEGAIFTLPAVDFGEFEAVIQGRQGAIAQGIGFFPKEDANGVAVQIDLFGV